MNQTFPSSSAAQLLLLLLSAFWVLVMPLPTWSWCCFQFFRTWSSLVLVRLRSSSRESRMACSSCFRTARMFSKHSWTCCFIISVLLYRNMEHEERCSTVTKAFYVTNLVSVLSTYRHVCFAFLQGLNVGLSLASLCLQLLQTSGQLFL